MFPKFNIQYTDSGGVLLCPSCNTDYLHQGRVNFFYPAQECHVMVDAPLVQVDQSMEGNPSIERQGLTVEFWCENCHGISVLAFDQHKGHTIVGFKQHAEVSWRLP